jgi:prophage maintenance system killer protein
MGDRHVLPCFLQCPMQPRARFGGAVLYLTLADKVSSLAFSLVLNHPVSDCNKPTEYGALIMFLNSRLSRVGYLR